MNEDDVESSLDTSFRSNSLHGDEEDDESWVDDDDADDDDDVECDADDDDDDSHYLSLSVLDVVNGSGRHRRISEQSFDSVDWSESDNEDNQVRTRK